MPSACARLEAGASLVHYLFLTSASPLGQELGSLLLERELGSERQSNLSRDVQPEGEEKEEDKYPRFCRETITSAS